MKKMQALFIFFVVAGLAIMSATASAQGGLQSATKPELEAKNRKYFTDLPVVTHEGQELRFYSDLLKDRIAVISFFYTNCPTAQASLSTLVQVQKMLGDRLGREVILISLSVDPERDSLQAVKKYAAKYGPMKGWMFVTGKRENIETINMRLGNRSTVPEFHIQLFLMGNLKTGQWMRLPERASADVVSEGLRNLLPGFNPGRTQ